MKLFKNNNLVSREILDLILEGEIKPGEKLPSAGYIAKKTGVSIVTARESIKKLETIGLITILHGRGIYLTEGKCVIEDLLEARKFFECHNVMMAAQKITDSQLKKLDGLIKGMDEDIKNSNISSFSEMDHEFHVLIAKFNGNRILFKAFENIRNLLLYQQLTINQRYSGMLEKSAFYHKSIFNALINRDSASARSLMAQHLDEVLDMWKKYVSNL